MMKTTVRDHFSWKLTKTPVLPLVALMALILCCHPVSAQFQTPIGGFYGVVYEKDLPPVVPTAGLSSRMRNLQLWLAKQSNAVLGQSVYYTQIYFVSFAREYDEYYGYYYRVCWYWNSYTPYTYSSKNTILSKSKTEFEFLYTYWCPVLGQSSTSSLCASCTTTSRSCSTSESTYWRCFCSNFYRGNYITNPVNYATSWGPYTPAPPCLPGWTNCTTPTPYSPNNNPYSPNNNPYSPNYNPTSSYGGSTSSSSRTNYTSYVIVGVMCFVILAAVVSAYLRRRGTQAGRRNNNSASRNTRNFNNSNNSNHHDVSLIEGAQYHHSSPHTPHTRSAAGSMRGGPHPQSPREMTNQPQHPSSSTGNVTGGWQGAPMQPGVQAAMASYAPVAPPPPSHPPHQHLYASTDEATIAPPPGYQQYKDNKDNAVDPPFPQGVPPPAYPGVSGGNPSISGHTPL